MPAQLILAGLLAFAGNIVTIIVARFALWADFAFYLRLYRSVPARRKRADERWTLADAWEATLARTPPSKACVVCAESSRSFTFTAVDRESNRAARWALSLGLKPRAEPDAGAATTDAGDVVALLLDSSPEMVIFILGLAKAGVVVAPIDVERRGPRLADAIVSSGASVLLFGGRFETAVTAIAAQLARRGVGLHLFAPELGFAPPAPAAAADALPAVTWAHAAMADLGVGPVKHLLKSRVGRTADGKGGGGLEGGGALSPFAPCVRVETESSVLAEEAHSSAGGSGSGSGSGDGGTFGPAAGESGVGEDGGSVGAAPARSATAWHTLTHATLLELGSCVGAECGLRATDSLYCPLALEHYFGLTAGLLSTVITGCTLVTRPRLDVGAYWSDCAELGCTALLHEGSTLSLLAALPRAAPEQAHNVRLAIGPAIGRPLTALLEHRFLIPEAMALLTAPAGADSPLVLAVRGAGAAGAAVGASGRIGHFRDSARKELVVARAEGGALQPEQRAQCEPCARGEAGLLLARAGAGAAELGFKTVRVVRLRAGPSGEAGAGSGAAARGAGAGEWYVSTGLLARHERFGGWVHVLGHAATPGLAIAAAAAGDSSGGEADGASGAECATSMALPTIGPAEAARALAGADGLADAVGYAVAVPGPPGSRPPVCIVALATVDGRPPDVKALGSLLLHGLPKGRRSPLLLRHTKELAARTRTAVPRTAALVARGVEPAAHGEPMWWWDERAELFVPFGEADVARLARGELS